MACEQFRHELILLVFGELDEQRRTAVERHVRSCPECRAARAAASRVARWLGEDQTTLPPELREATLARMGGALRATRHRRWSGALAAAAAAAIILGAVAWKSFHRPRQPARPAVVLSPAERKTPKQVPRRGQQELSWSVPIEHELDRLSRAVGRAELGSPSAGLVTWELQDLSDRLDRLMTQSPWDVGPEPPTTSRPQSQLEETDDEAFDAIVRADGTVRALAGRVLQG